jgi:hypothetical protein
VDPELHGLGSELLKKFDNTEQALLTVRRGATRSVLSLCFWVFCLSLRRALLATCQAAGSAHIIAFLGACRS